jgi:hypothetical protein
MIKLLSRKEDGDSESKLFHAGWDMKVPIVVLLATVFLLGVFFPQQLTDLLNAIVTELGFR